ncbi:alpha/beta fold hydrolase [Pontibacter harenae]|uniref:alpha/beta fold hydrolase n=1 Tax=Pontibacter harenae TaxID=2894083 RepID=UPI001E3E5BBB|nr:alpha/beta hydrolase [Pontibacter harenae]MCC9168972.1 alpha/beta hydrolase [Pontibacter harenae]
MQKSIRIRLLLVLLMVANITFSQAQDPKRLRHFLQATPTPANATPYGNNPKAGRYVKAGDAKIYYEVYGKGESIVILHGGIVGSTLEMAQFIDSLSQSYQVIAVSTRGHGKSEMGSQVPSYERKAEDVNAIIKAVTKDSVTVLGFSDGAYTGYFLAASHPEKVKKLIAIGAGEWKQGFRTFNNSREVLFGMDSIYFKQQLTLMPEPQRFEEWLMTLNRYYNSISIGKETLGAIDCPVLVMAGELDQNAPLKTVIAAYEMIPKAQLSIIPNAPHPVFLVNFPAVWASMTPFLKQ